MKITTIPANIIVPILKVMNILADFGDFAARLWIAKIFFDSGMSKIVDWGATFVLFKYDYHVPLLSPMLAAYLGTAAEFILPFLLVIGLGGRISIFILFVYNVICVVSFHDLWTPAGAAGLADHISWGLLLLLLVFHGPGRFSLDHWIHKKFGYLYHYGPEDQYRGKWSL